MTREIEKTIGLDFEKLKIASIVQQGELNAIINAKPKEFKELINAIIGIDKLDVASESMKIVNKEFREKIRDKIGYDDTDIEKLSQELEIYQKEIKEAKPEKNQLESKQEKLRNEVDELRKKVETEGPKIDKINQLELRKKELLEYAKEAIREMQHEINENESKIRDCKGCFEHASLKEDLESKIQKVEQIIEDTLKKIQELTNQAASLKEKQLLASKLQLKDNKCPVCDSHVEKLNPLFQEEHLKEEMKLLKEEIISKEKERDLYNQKRKEFSEKLQHARDAEATLRAHSINNKEELMKIQENVEAKRQNIQKIPLSSNGNLLEISQIDSHAKIIFENISKLEMATRGFNEHEFTNLKKLVNEKQMNLSEIDQRIGAISEKISKGEKQINIIQSAISELKIVKEYVTSLDEIQMKIFSRDG
ncbi:MAG: SMC family ATPase, partial [Nitrosopumilus sp.]